MCMHSVLSVAAPDEKGGDWKLIFSARFKLWNRSFTPNDSMWKQNSQKGPSLKPLFMISDVILRWCRSGMITKHLFALCMYESNFEMIFCELTAHPWRVFTSQKTKDETCREEKKWILCWNAFSAFEKTAEETCRMWWQRKEWVFLLFAREIYSCATCITCRWRSKKGNSKGNEDLQLIRVKSLTNASQNYLMKHQVTVSLTVL